MQIPFPARLQTVTGLAFLCQVVQQVHRSVSPVQVCKMDTPSFGNIVTIIFIILLNYSSILPFSPPVLFFQVMMTRVKHPSSSKIILGKTWNETEFWQKPFRVKFRGDLPPSPPAYIKACVGRRKNQLFHALAGIWRCIKLE